MITTDQITCSVAEAQRLSSLGKTTLYKAMSEGRISSTLIGTKRLIHVGSLRRFLEAE